MFLCETLCKNDLKEKVRKMMGFEGVFSVDVQRKSGGLALLWRSEEQVQLFSYSRNHIDVIV